MKLWVLFVLFTGTAWADCSQLDSVYLETPHYLLRALSPQDTKALADIFDNPELWKAQNYKYRGKQPLTGASYAEDFSAWPEALRLESVGKDWNRFSVAVERKSDHVVVGYIGLEPASSKSVAEVSYAVNEKYWKQGIMKESLRPFLDHFSQILGLREIEAVTSSDNDPSQLLLKSLGFKEEGSIPFIDMRVIDRTKPWKLYRLAL